MTMNDRKRRQLHPSLAREGQDADQRRSDGWHSQDQSPWLPPEVLAQIFRDLDVQSKGRTAQVSRAWRYASYQPSVWRGVGIHVDLEPSTKPTWFRILPRMRGIRSPDLSDFSASHAFLQEMNHLTTVTVSPCGLVTQDGVDTLVRCFRHIVSLCLDNCRGINDSLLLLLASQLRRLAHLDLRNCKEVTDLGVAYLAGLNRPPMTDGTTGTVPILVTLVLRGCREVTDQALLYLATGQGSLACLDIGMCDRITDGGLHHLARLGQLRSMNLAFCEKLTDNGMVVLARIVSLRDLDISGTHVGDVGIAALSQRGSRITNLELKACLHITDRCCKYLAKMADLRTVSICGCPHIGDEGLGHLAHSKIKIVNLAAKRPSTRGLWWQ